GTRAGTDALATGLGGDGPALVVASDAPRGAPDDEIEHAGGAGAAAVLLTADGGGSVRDRAERTTTAPGTRFRPAGSDETTGLGITAYDRSSFTEAVTTVADALEYDPASADAVALQSPNGTLPYRVAGPLEVDTETIRAGTTVHDLGDTGAASPLLGFASALESGCDSVLLLGYGADGATGLAFGLEAGGVAVSTRLEGDETLSYGEYLRRRGDITPGEPAGGGAYVSVPNWKRTLPQRHRLVAGRCPKCGELAFPPGGACPDCGALEAFDEVALPGTGTVEAATVIGQGGAPPEFVEQQAREGAYVSAVVALDGPDSDGDRATVSTPAQVLTVGDESVSPGDRVEATIRRIYTQEGVTRYGFKMRRLE
ncbi:zinc ribbon domain-containing protein, partial [Halobiforma nitratireducens]